MSAQPESQSAMDADGETGGRVSPEATDPSSLAQREVRRQTPKVGAECPNWARSDLSGGRSEMSVPTGNVKTRVSLENGLAQSGFLRLTGV